MQAPALRERLSRVSRELEGTKERAEARVGEASRLALGLGLLSWAAAPVVQLCSGPGRT